MRNDARPIGEETGHQSPVVPDHTEADSRESVTHDRQSHIVNRNAEDDARDVDRHAVDEDQTMPTGDSTLNTKI
jgi:hypothetical protein